LPRTWTGAAGGQIDGVQRAAFGVARHEEGIEQSCIAAELHALDRAAQTALEDGAGLEAIDTRGDGRTRSPTHLVAIGLLLYAP
jgi:hypothetical protein